jgi:hypothetical protein
MFRAGDAVNIVVGTYETSIRPDCEFMPLVKLPDHWRTRAAWQDGMWARAQWYTGGLTIAFARSLGETVDPHRVPSTGAVTMEVFDVAPLGDDDWVVAFSDGGVRTAVFDEAGHLVGTSKVSDAPAARVILVPIEHNRTLLIQQQIVWDAPFHGVYRVVVTPLTTESASRRRTVRR